MKRIISTLFGLAVLCLFAEAQAVPTTVSFTGRLSTSNGPVSGNVNVTFSLFNQATNGTVMWTETRNNLPANNGLVYADLGTMTTLDEGILTNAPLFLEIQVGAEVLSPRLPLQSVPYSIRSEIANSADTLGTIAPGDVVTTVTQGAGVNVARNGNSVTVGLLTTCSANQVLKAGAGGTWSCAADTDTNTTYSATANGGLTFTGTTIGLLTTCAAGQVLKAGAGGTWACANDTDTTTTYTAAANGGISVVGTTIGLLTTCSNGQVLKAGAVAGQWACANDVDTNTTYSLSCSNVTVTDTVVAGGSALTFATCGAGTIMSGGGCDTTGGPGVASRVLYETYPSGNGWACGYYNSSTTTTMNVAAYARCCQI